MPKKFQPMSRETSTMVQLPDSADDLPALISVDLESDDENNFSVVDDTPEADRGRPTNVEGRSVLEDDDVDDLREHVSARTRKRFDRFKYELETERRARQQTERERDAAVEATRAAMGERDQLRQANVSGNAVLAETMLSRNKTALDAAKNRFKAAHESGDSDALVEAQTDISRLAAEELAIKSQAPRKPASGQQQPRQAAPAATQQPQPPIAPNVAAWISNNSSWFQKPGQEARTNLAYATHNALLARGVAPASDEYTRELDKAIKIAYPEHKPMKAEDTSTRTGRRPNAAAEGSRDTVKDTDSRTGRASPIELTRSEVSIAKRLGVPLQRYAAEKSRYTPKGAQKK